MRAIFIPLATVSICAVFAGCIRQASPYPKSAVYDFDADANVLTIESRGGHSNDFIERAWILEETHPTVIVKNVCISACAEYILPVASKIILEDSPIVAMHGSPIILQMVRDKAFNNEPSGCLETSSQMLKMVQDNNSVHPDYNQDQINYLSVKSVERGDVIQGCQLANVMFENDYWLPTSAQLDKYFAADIEGKTCADELESCKETLDRRWRKGGRYIIGETLYISNGVR